MKAFQFTAYELPHVFCSHMYNTFNLFLILMAFIFLSSIKAVVTYTFSDDVLHCVFRLPCFINFNKFSFAEFEVVLCSLFRRLSQPQT